MPGLGHPGPAAGRLPARVAALPVLVLAPAPRAVAAPEEIEVNQDAGDADAPCYRLTPELSYGVSDHVELGFLMAGGASDERSAALGAVAARVHYVRPLGTGDAQLGATSRSTTPRRLGR